MLGGHSLSHTWTLLMLLTLSPNMTGKLRRCGRGGCGGRVFPGGAGKLFSSSGYQTRERGLPGTVLLLVQFKTWSVRNEHKTYEAIPLLTMAPRLQPFEHTTLRERQATPQVARGQG